MSLFQTDALGFYLQDAYVKDWIDNTMLFLEVDDVNRHCHELQKLNLTEKYKEVKLTAIRNNDWGSEYFLGSILIPPFAPPNGTSTSAHYICH